jgi:hypothetical protein
MGKTGEEDAEKSDASAGPGDAPPEANMSETKADAKSPSGAAPTARITFALSLEKPLSSKALYIPPPRARDNGGWSTVIIDLTEYMYG